MGISIEDVRSVPNRALTDVPSDQKPDCRLAHDGRLKVVYNPSTHEIVTVFWLTHDWLPDRYQHPELQVSGWINLDAKQAEKLLTDWGFVVHSTKDRNNLWTHPDDPENRLVPFSVPGRGAKANGKGSFRIAAQIVGVNVNQFLRGGDTDTLAELRRKRQLTELAEADRLMRAPQDPLGLNQMAAAQKLSKLQQEINYPAPTATAEQEYDVPSMTANDEKVLQALLEQHSPQPPYALSASTGLHERVVRESLRKLEKAGDAFRVGAAPSRGGAGRGGAPASLWWCEATFTEPLPKPTPAPAPLAEETPVPTALIQSALGREARASVALDGETHVVDLVAAPGPVVRVFEETEIRWPSGGIVIKDDAGNLYVARALTEEGR